MKMGSLIVAALAMSFGFGVSSAFAQENICLRTQRIDNWQVVDDKTLILTDRLDRQYKLGLVGACTRLQQTRFSLGFETFSELSCIRPGGSIRFTDLTFGPQRCRITSIESYIAEEAESPVAESPIAESPIADSPDGAG